MSVNTETTETKLTFRRYRDGDTAVTSLRDKIFQASYSHKCPTYVQSTPPCQGSCPSGEDIRGYLSIVRGIEKPPADMPWQEYAWRRLTEANPFPSVMGRVCPAPCESGCNRNEVEDFVGINSVEHFLGEYAIEGGLQVRGGPGYRQARRHRRRRPGGPVGRLPAAPQGTRGDAVRRSRGARRHGEVRRAGLPAAAHAPRRRDQPHHRHGCGGARHTRIGRDVTLKDLEAQYDAVLIAIGCKAGRPLPVPGADAPNCISGVAFLEAFNQGRLKAVAGRVVVVGGGDTSVDVVSVARRLGYIEEMQDTERPENVVMGHTAHDVSTLAARQGADVMLTSMQPIEQMNAARHEIEDAQREGVKIEGNLLPKKVIVDEKSGRAVALRVIEVEWQKGKFTEKPGTERDLEADLIVVAIGQAGDLAGMEELDNGKGFVAADKFYQLPNRPGVFACGDILRPHLLTTVIGQGSVAADSIDRYLKGEEFAKRPKVDVHHFNLLEKLRETHLEPAKYEASPENGPRPIDQGVRGTSLAGKAVGGFAVHNYEDRSAAEVCKSEELFLGHFPYQERIKRTEIGPSAEEVLGHFEERMVGLTDKQAVDEAKRCMSCGMCFECDNCVIYCPQTAVKRTPKSESTMGRYVYTDYDLCIGCHICADVCPTGYIKMGMGDH
jgi:glutamate synthase (NADPH) small chain